MMKDIISYLRENKYLRVCEQAYKDLEDRNRVWIVRSLDMFAIVIAKNPTAAKISSDFHNVTSVKEIDPDEEYQDNIVLMHLEGDDD